MKYIKFSDEELNKADSVSLVGLLQSYGEQLKKSGSEYEWDYKGEKVTIRNNFWYSHYTETGGKAISFVQKYFGMSFPDAVVMLLDGTHHHIICEGEAQSRKKEFRLPERNENMNRVFAYLSITRGIDKEIIWSFSKADLIYESKEYHNAIFVGKNKAGKAVHAHKRSSGSYKSYKANAPGSMPQYSFNWRGKSDRLYLFEAPIDMLSFISMHKKGWKNHSYAACCGVADNVLFQLLQDNPNIKTVLLCLDNDEAGQSANARITEKLKGKGVNYEILIPKNKDWNEDLLSQMKGDEEKCQATLFSYQPF